MKYLHTMIRVSDPEETIRFLQLLGLKETRRHSSEQGRFTLIYLAAPGDEAELELTHNWDPEAYDGGRNFGHVAYQVENIYETCQRLMDAGYTINRPPRDGHMALSRSNCCRTAVSIQPSLGPPCPMLDSGSGRGRSHSRVIVELR